MSAENERVNNFVPKTFGGINGLPPFRAFIRPFFSAGPSLLRRSGFPRVLLKHDTTIMAFNYDLPFFGYEET